MNSFRNVRSLFIEFFQKYNHVLFKPIPIVVPGDTTMFTIAGMKQFIDIFLNLQPAQVPRAISIQPCLRTNDLELIGKTSRHHSFFEMLGNFSFHDYFKEEAIFYAYSFFKDVLDFDFRYIYITVFHTDSEAYKRWAQFVPNNHIILLETEDNYWKSGTFGPCGRSSEIYFDKERKLNEDLLEIKRSIIAGEERFLEIWNLVFMEDEDTPAGRIPLKHKSIDTGIGLERLISVLDGSFHNYETYLLKDIVEHALQFTHNIEKARIVADHMRAIVFLINEGLTPANDGPGYVLRKLIRRAFLFCNQLTELSQITVQSLDYYKLDQEKPNKIILNETNHFQVTLRQGMNILNKAEHIDAKLIFNLYDTYGLPIDISKEILQSQNQSVNWQEVQKLQEQHKQVSKKKLFIPYQIPTQVLFYDQEYCQTNVNLLGIYGQDKSEYINQESINQGEFLMICNASCFYPRGGGQEGDHGHWKTLYGHGKILDSFRQKITNSEFIIVHYCNIEYGYIQLKDNIELIVDINLRQARTRAHSAAHLFGEYFMKNLGYKQVGSFVDEDYFRLDLETNMSGPIDPMYITNAIAQTQLAIQEHIQTQISYENFTQIKDTISLSGHEYGDVVRVVKFGEISKQLCGGTHVINTSDIINIKLRKESAIKHGVRRLECYTGPKLN